jgi:hypothetical protein
VVVFRLDGALAEYGPEFVRRLHTRVNGPPPESPAPIFFARPVSLLLYGLLLLDSFLDARGWPGLLLLAWAAAGALIIRRDLLRPRSSGS